LDSYGPVKIRTGPALNFPWRSSSDSTRIYFKVDVELLPIVELAHRLGVALVPIKLCVHLIVDIRGKRRKSILAILAHNVGFYGAGTRVRQIDHRVRQGSILTVTSYPNRTSVVQRGKWVLENLLGTPPPPPPADVPELKPEGKDGKPLPLRQAMEQHRANAVCAGCHARMDPIGFALENYDAIGRWRSEDAGSPIDVSGKLPDGAQFVGPGQLAKLLATNYRDDFVSTVTEKLLTYALGRGLEYYDQPAVRSITREAAREHYSMTSLVIAIVNSMPFQMRRSSDQ